MDTKRSKGIGTVGSRLRDERKRLRMSQEAFAQRCGIHRRTQVNYELDRRTPGADYWDAIDNAGACSTFVLSGKDELFTPTRSAVAASAFARVLHAMGFEPEFFEALLTAFHDLELRASRDAMDSAAFAALESLGSKIVADSPSIQRQLAAASEIDADLMTAVLAAVDDALGSRSAASLGSKRGPLVAAAYSAARAAGRVDRAVVARLVHLVS
jgi:DNA-binding XRE family transcriptional regulator